MPLWTVQQMSTHVFPLVQDDYGRGLGGLDILLWRRVCDLRIENWESSNSSLDEEVAFSRSFVHETSLPLSVLQCHCRLPPRFSG